MNSQELKNAYREYYDLMAQSKNPDNMKLFGKVMTEMYMWFADNKPENAAEWLEKLSAIKWDNYLTPKEAERVVSEMEPKAPWSRDMWRQVMEQHGYPLEEEPYYNRCALWTTMNMIMSDSSETLSKYVSSENMFRAVHDLAVDKLCDADSRFMIRHYFNV